MSMSEAGHFNSHQEFIRQTKREIFGRFTDILMDGTYYPPKHRSQPCEMVEPVPQLGAMAVCSAEVEIVDFPDEIHVSWCRPEIGRYAELWLTADEIEIQYGEWDDDHNPYTITERKPIHPEALMELHQQIMNAPS